MGVTTITEEFACPIPAARMFKAFLDSHNLLPKLMPHAYKNVEIAQGDGGAGTIKHINFAQGAGSKTMKHRIDALDKVNFECKYTIIEGDVLGDDKKTESITHEVKFQPSASGGCVVKLKGEYHTKGGFEIKEDEIKAKKEKAMAMYKVMEAYLLEKPDAYI